MKKDESPMNCILRSLSEGGPQPDCLKRVLKDFRKRKQWTEDTQRQFLSSLAECLILPGGAEAIVRKCPQMLLPLLSVASSQPYWQQRGIIALGTLAKLHPDAARFALQHLKGPEAPFHTENLEPPQAKKMKVPDKPPTQYQLLKACLALLQSNRSHFSQLWNWSPVIDLLNCTDDKIRWLACESLALLLGMPEKARHSLQSHLFPEKVRQQFVLQECHVPQEPLFAPESSEDSSEELEKLCSLCPNVVCVAGVILPALPNRVSKPELDLEMVASTQANLRSLAVAAAAGRPVLLQGPVGCGKTALVEYLAALTGRTGPPDLLKVQLGDETDSKMLLGAYCCTEVPGEFIWQPGVLTQAIQRGAWLLLEDIDCAGMDVISVLASLIETNSLAVPGYRDCVRAAPTFQLFATQRLTQGSGGFHRSHSSPSAVLDDLWLQLSVEPLARHELNAIIESKFPALAPVASRLLDVFLLFSQGSHAMALESAPLSRAATGMDEAPQPTTTGPVGRLISTRDLLKWCARVVPGFDGSSPDCALRILQDAIDLFCCSSSSPDEMKQQAIAVAGRLGIVSTKADFYCSQYKPTITINPTKVIAGRASIPRLTSLAAGLQSHTAVFSLTRAASCLLERVACCVARSEPVLLVGETGAGKTATVQLLAQRAGRHLRVINMNQHSDSADLLGGFKPVDLKLVIGPVREEFERLFCITFKREANLKFLHHIATCFSARRWDALLALMRHSLNAALKKAKEATLLEWQHLSDRMERLESQLKAGNASLAFSFIEGALVRAVLTGEWVLLDEINLASAETLQCLSGLLEGSTGSLHLLERGDEKPITRHPEFRLFACMNPATDVGKKDLPPGLRNRFTELFVEELSDKTDLIQLAACYLGGLGLKASRLESLVKLYLQLRTEANKNLASGTGHKPHFSLRTFCRALSVATSNPCGSVSRSLLEAFNLSFLTQLDRQSQQVVEELIVKAVCGKESKSVLNQPLPEPSGGRFNKVEGFWVQQGDEEVHIPDKYILTQSVRGHLKSLARAVSLGRAPVLLQGETSVGKTSLVSYLAQITGHRCLRINNHEHTDLQEYLGQYVVGTDGQLTFKEGALVEAMRKGHWVILDELNLAPSDVLEALNRVLDDNRELFIPETQTLVQAHPRFMLFATQNPPGLYGGRKLLSRAFRNRFVELHFGEIPSKELEIILQERCALPASYAKKMVAVMGELQIRRRGSAAFAGKQGFMTLRDLFRWGERYRLASIDSKSKHNWEQHLADEGYLVLAGRVRRAEEALVIQEAIKKHLKCQLDPDYLFTLNSNTSAATRDILEVVTKACLPGFEHIVWTFNMRRLAVLVGKAVQFSEPALLVGETGCGKTSVCQLLAALRGHSLLSVNCHMHTEAADFLGSLRPVREHQDKDHLFEWMDGPLVQAMSSGDWFLADEISLADDSVLERLNSLLEPERSLLLAEKGGECTVTAEPSFQFVATMNPGGDFGKKELSPALRNRLTEVWCEGCESQADRVAVVERSVRPGLALGNQQDGTSGIGHCAAAFVTWLQSTELGSRLTVSVRDLLTWVHFINVVSEQDPTGQSTALDLGSAYVHGACLTFLDSLGSGVTSGASGGAVAAARKAAIRFLNEQISKETGQPPDFNPLADEACKIHTSERYFGMKPFFIEKGQGGKSWMPNNFLFEAPSTCISVLRLLRALQLSKPVLLEGSPGVGKTSLVHAVANAAGHPITRINLSDQTDASDLFGADLPVEGGVGGQFAWRDGPFLQALKAGHWIVLDELNLASQSVLEALNACLDHRGEVYIPELGRSFQVQAKNTRLFACQNPQRQGGARRGLPRSFLNRFTQVYIEALTPSDLKFIATSSFPDLPRPLLSQMVTFSCRVAHETGELRTWGSRGGPWEMNLRDLSRWAMAARGTEDCNLGPEAAAKLIYVERMRTQEDRMQMSQVFEEEVRPLPVGLPRVSLTPEFLSVGGVRLPRGNHCQSARELLLLRSSLPTLHALASCVHHNWLAILVGGPGSGKSSSVSLLAGLAGRALRVLAVNSAMDTTEILGGFEQTDLGRHLDELATTVQTCVSTKVGQLLAARFDDEARALLQAWEDFQNASSLEEPQRTLSAETRFFQQRAQLLEQVLVTLGSQDLLLQLRDVVARAKSAGTLNAGGRFEWVDSVLVKCLREGSWLLLENVNVCSAAVLDRLNALLEPGGSLVLGERGARSDGGGLHVVTPHPDFRLFFTMDPRHGDISRAMRNRGVEIFVPGPGEDAPPLDLRALLANAGVSAYAEQQALLAAHRTLRALVIGTEAVPSLPWLLRAAFLVRQNMLRGAGGSARALYFACLDVYVKPRASAEAKRQALAALEEVLTSSPLTSLPQDLLPPSATLQVAALQENSSLAAIQQQGSVLATVLASLARHTTQTSSFLNQLCHLSCNDVCLERLVSPLLLAFYFGSSSADAQLRHSWLMSQAPHLQATSHKLCSVIQELSHGVQPWDPRWQGYVDAPDESLAARLSLLLQFLLLQANESTSQPTNSKELSVLKYSQLLVERRVSDSLTNCAVVTQLSRLLTLLDLALVVALREEQLTPTDVATLRRGLHWRSHLRSYADSCPISAATVSQVVSALTVHARWLAKKLLSPLFQLSGTNSASVSNELKTLLVELDLDGDQSSLYKVARKVLPRLSQPLPYNSKQQTSVCLALELVVRELQLWPAKDKSIWLRLLTWLATPAGVETRQRIVNTLAHLQLRQDVGEGAVINVEQLSKEVSATDVLTRMGGDVLAKEYLCLLLATRLRLQMLLQSGDLQLKTLLSQLAAMLNTTTTAPLRVQAAILAVTQQLANGSCTPSCRHHLLSCLLEWQTRYSPVTTAPALWLDWSRCDTSNEESSSNVLARQLQVHLEQRNLSVALWCPVLSYIVTQETLGKDESLGESETHARKLNSLGHLVWCGTQASSTSTYNVRSMELECIKAAFSQFLAAVSSAGSGSFLDRVASWRDSSLPLASLLHTAEQLAALMDSVELDIAGVGQAWVLLGSLNLSLAAAWPTMDPVQSRALKLKYIEAEMEEGECTLYAHDLVSRVVGETSSEFPQAQHPHPLLTELREHCQALTAQKNKLATYVAVRPEPSQYAELQKMVRRYSGSIGSTSTVLELSKQLLLTAHRHLTPSGNLLNQEESWQASQRKFCEDLTAAGSLYPDLIQPVLYAANQMSHGMSLLSSQVKRVSEQRDLTHLGLACRLPAFHSSMPSHLALARATNSLIHTTSSDDTTLTMGLQMSTLEELRNDVVAFGQLRPECVTTMTRLMGQLAETWMLQEQERKQSERESQSLYRVQNKQQEEVEVQQAFPSYHREFEDLAPGGNDTLNAEPMQTEEPEPVISTAVHITLDDLSHIGQLHSQVFQGYTHSQWLSSQSPNFSPRHARPLLLRLQALKLILPSTLSSLDSNFDQDLIGSCMLLLRHGGHDPEPNPRPHDFYRDPLPSETVRCRPLLVAIKKRVNELMQEWPEHPTLLTLDKVCVRLLGFSSQSPVAKLLCGLELLLSQLQDWEAHAHAGVSLGALSQATAQMVLEWRRMELQQWSEALSTVQDRFERHSLGRWWCHLVSLLLEEQESDLDNKLLSAVQQFMEQSTLGDFSARLQLLKAFHCHTLHLPQSQHHDKLQRLLWNAYIYFSQFSLPISAQLRSKRAPIEKKLKEIVKISRWTDTNYWALRQTTMKTHRTLHKHMKEFQEVLVEPATSAMTVSAAAKVDWTAPFQPTDFLSSLTPKTSAPERLAGVPQASRWFKKAQKLSKELLLTAPYPHRIHSLFQFASDITDTTKLVQSQTVPAAQTDKKQRKSQVKHLLQCKRKAVADTFRSLTRIGLSYRTGMAHQHNPVREAFLAAPLDIQASISSSNNSADASLLYAWQGCSSLLSASLARLAQLRAALEKPSSDLGPVGLDKCHGFSLHLMELVQEQYSLIAEVWSHMLSLRRQFEILNSMPVIPSKSFIEPHREALTAAATCSSWLEQFSLMLRCLPEPSESSEQEFLPGFPSPTPQQISDALTVTSELKAKVQAVKTSLLSVDLDLPLISSTCGQALQSVGPQLSSIAASLPTLTKLSPSSVTEGLEWVRERLESAAEALNLCPTAIESAEGVENVAELTEKLHTQALLLLQRLYQHHTKPDTENAALEEEDEELLEEGHLKVELVTALKRDIADLKLTELDGAVKKLVTVLATNPACANVVQSCVPLLDQVLLVVHYLVVQLTGSLRASSHLLCELLALTTLLAHKGFNMPEETKEEESGDGPTQPASGLGLGEGEGEKNVSDRLESEDQLEGARQEGQEEEEPADKDVKEEDGVEVSEDFEGKLQDREPAPEGEGSDQEGEEEKDDEDTGQEIGETGEDAECLDKQVWGSDSEEEEGEMGETDKGRGEEKDDVVPEVGAAGDEEGPEQQNQKDWDAQEQQEFPEDQADTQHGKAPPLQEPEPLDLPDDLQLDGGEEEGNAEDETENPFETQELTDIKESTEVKETDQEEPAKDEGSDEEGGESDEEGGESEREGGEREDDQAAPEECKEPGAEDETAEKGTAQEDEEMPAESDTREEDAEEPEGTRGDKSETPAEAAPAQGTTDSSAQNENAAPQQEQHASGDAGEDRGQEGAAQAEEGHASASQVESKMAAPASEPQSTKKEPRERRRPGEADSTHTLGDVKEPAQKRVRLAEGMADYEQEDQDEDTAEQNEQNKSEGDLHQHVKEAKEHTTQTMDAATQEQARQQQPTVGKEEETGEEPENEDLDVPEDDAEEVPTSSTKELRSEKTEVPGQKGRGEGDTEGAEEEKITVEGENVTTQGVQRGGGCSFHTLPQASEEERRDLTPDEVAQLRLQLERQLATWTQPPASAEAAQAWSQFSAATSGLARDLCEQLRLVLEPTQASRLRGDYRTGRRINMRKVIPYIASEFRKDKIWLRRTRPSRRTYQVVLALDDSSSMADNHSKELAFESLALVSQALTLLEAGELGVLSFGEEPHVLHPLGQPFTEDSGARLVQQLSFSQRHTRVGRLVSFATSLLTSCARHNPGAELAQLLVIVSDGRGVYSEGKDAVHQAVRAAREARVFIVFLAIEDPNSKDSILDIRMPVFSEGKLLGISSYLDNFPFPYYLILRDVESLPTVLSDALRQWFELTANALRL